MFSFTRFLAWRYLRQSTYEKSISPMIFISFISILTGAWALALVTAIMHGFEQKTHEKIQSIQPQLIIKSTNDPLNVSAITQLFEKQFPQVAASSPFTMQHIIIRTTGSSANPNVAMLKGVNPTLESIVIPINSKIISGPNTIEQALNNNGLLIGKGLAKELRSHVNDTVEILYMEDSDAASKRVNLETASTHIGGIFDTGIEEYDNNLVFCSLDFLQELFPDIGITYISLKLGQHANESATKQQLSDILQLPVYSWKDLYPAIISALKLERYAMIFILLLICFVASMNIFALLFMFITQKRNDIALLYALGSSPGHIMRIFITIGMVITMLATTLGIIGAAISSYTIDHYQLITLPDVYYVSHVPAQLEWITILWIYLLVLCISFIAIWYPAYKTKSLVIAQVLRYEG